VAFPRLAAGERSAGKERLGVNSTWRSHLRGAGALSVWMEGSTQLARLAAEIASAPTPRAALRRLGELRRELDAFERRQVAQALAEGTSYAAIARDLGLSRQAVHRRFRTLAPAGPALLTAPEVGRILQYAREEAASLGAGAVGSEHILLAVLRAGDLPAADLLRSAGVTLERARAQVEAASPRARFFRRDPEAGDLLAFLEAPIRDARARGGRGIEVEDVLRGALADPDGGAARTLRALGAEPGRIRDGLSST
jgi:ATP-dependent Clp protease ATP-binding subunit ClpA